MQAVLERYDRILEESQSYVEALGSPRETYLRMSAMECGNYLFQAQLAWLERVIERIKKGQLPPVER